MAFGNLAYADQRRDVREEVHYRARGTHHDGRALQLVVVNLSAGGLMARCDASIVDGDALTIMLPGIGAYGATVRWSLGGRIGCAFDRTVPGDRYFALLTAMRR